MHLPRDLLPAWIQVRSSFRRRPPGSALPSVQREFSAPRPSSSTIPSSQRGSRLPEQLRFWPLPVTGTQSAQVALFTWPP